MALAAAVVGLGLDPHPKNHPGELGGLGESSGTFELGELGSEECFGLLGSLLLLLGPPASVIADRCFSLCSANIFFCF